MSVLDRAALDESPLADLHTIASELSIDGYRRLRRGDLIDAILERQTGAAPAGDHDEDGEDRTTPRRRRGRRGGRGRAGGRDENGAPDPEAEEAEKETEAETEAETETAPARQPRARGQRAERAAPDERPARAGRAGAAKRRGAEPRSGDEAASGAEEEQVVEGVVELLANGSGFVRVSPPEPSDDDVYISAAQVKRCELVAGDRIAGPRRSPRRSERYPSLVRVDTINGRPANEVAEGARFDDLPAAFADESFALTGEDTTIKAIESLAPFGRGSRVMIVGPARAGKTEILRTLATAFAGHDGLEVSLVLAGVRPEEFAEWGKGPIEPAGAVSFAASADTQAQTVERVIEQARRLVARGANAVVLIDTLEGLHPPAARKALAAARNIVDGGSLTVIATAAKPFGGETTVIALDAAQAGAGQFPALDAQMSGTLRPELLVGEKGAEAIVKARAKAAKG